jgi:ABC-type dipeptide/oligopeptide/nickel transport system permease component
VRRLVLAHVLRPALPPAISVIALQLGFLLSGAVVTESIFARQGLGRLMVEAILWRDLPVVRGVVVVAALAYGLANLAADVAQTWLDPRLREGSS